MTRLSLFHWMMATLLIASLLSSCSPQPQKTLENLENASYSEVCAAQHYLRYAKQARQEGLTNIANLMEALAHSEYIQTEQIGQLRLRYDDHSLSELQDTLYVVGKTAENLQFVANAKYYKGKTAYPIFAATAADEQVYPVEGLFRQMTLVAQHHAKYCSKALEILNHDHDDHNVVNSWSVCPQCGCVYITACLTEHCVVCGEPASTFILFQ